ncbi:MAG TPA: lytic transglycosylase domain-containing protein [Rickettsiales bacterium]|nr:lytic transglycosylase domain-containing protein [Rickettsiales bacterium]
MVKFFSRARFLLLLVATAISAAAALTAPALLTAMQDNAKPAPTVSPVVTAAAEQKQIEPTEVKVARRNEPSNLRELAGARWKAGLAAFAKQDAAQAAQYFCAILDNTKLPTADRATVAFWAYRAFTAAGNEKSAKHYLEMAAAEDTSFYSILARHLNGNSTVSPNVQLSMAIEYATRKSDANNLYPMPDWKPASGYKLEPALLFAIMRQESAFNPHALSPSGAIGVMQLMPDTAHAMARSVRVRGSIGEPAVSMALGQQYVQHLMEMNSIGDNLVYLLAAYNAGPGALEKWQHSIEQKDPLLFIESIPYAATRDYVVNVIGNYWVYSELFGNANFSLSMIAQNEWPLYTSSVERFASK